MLDLDISPETHDILSQEISSIPQLINMTDRDILKIPGMSNGRLKELEEALRATGLNYVSSKVLGFKTGRPLGSKDIDSGSSKRRAAGRSNSWTSGNGQEGSDRFYLETEQVEVNIKAVDNYTKMFTDAMNGDHVEYEEKVAGSMAVMFVVYNAILSKISERVLKTGIVELPIFVIDRHGEVVTQDGEPVLKALKTPKVTIELMADLRSALGIDASALNLTAASQGRDRAITDRSVLADSEASKTALDEARNEFTKRLRKAS